MRRAERQGLSIVAGDAHPRLARRIARAAGHALAPCTLARFADGEIRVQLEGKLDGRDVWIVHPTSPPVNERLVTLALLADAARGAGAARVTALIPYFGYARQDVRTARGEARSAQVAARILECAGLDRVLVLEPHSQALENAFRIPFTELHADEAVLPFLRKWKLRNVTVVSPDAGGVKRAQRYAAALAAPMAVVAKRRPRPDAATALSLLGDVRGRQCLIVDDMASTGGTVAAAAQALQAAGAAGVHAFVMHAVMEPAALERIRRSGVRRLGATDSIAPDDSLDLEIVSVAPLLARALTLAA